MICAFGLLLFFSKGAVFISLFKISDIFSSYADFTGSSENIDLIVSENHCHLTADTSSSIIVVYPFKRLFNFSSVEASLIELTYLV